MRRIRNQRGAIDLILIAVVAILIAGLGGYIYYQQRQAQKTYDQAGGVTVAKHTKTTKKYLDDCSHFEFYYPSDWKLVSDTGVSAIFPKGCDVVTMTSSNGNKLVWEPQTYVDGPGCEGDGGVCIWGIVKSSQTVSKLSDMRIVKRVACEDANHSKCEGQIAVVTTKNGSSGVYSVGQARVYPLLDMGGQSHEFFMTQDKEQTTFAVSFKHTAAEAQAWLDSADVKAALTTMMTLSKR